jgi:hypothetical protein
MTSTSQGLAPAHQAPDAVLVEPCVNVPLIGVVPVTSGEGRESPSGCSRSLQRRT